MRSACLAAVVVAGAAALTAPAEAIAAQPPEPIIAGPADDLGARIDAFVKPLLDDGILSGVLLVTRGGSVVAQRVWGMADYEHSVANTLDTRFCIASISKPITRIMLQQLVDAGELSWDAKVVQWCPQVPGADTMTLAMLRDHTSGIPHRVTEPRDETVPISAAEMVDRVATAKSLFAPGQGESYSSAGYSVLARVLEIVSGRPYDVLLQDRICNPAAMRRTAHIDHTELLPDRARSYFAGVDGPEHAPLKDTSFLVGAGSIWSTAGDLDKLCAALAAGRLPAADRTQQFLPSGDHAWTGRTNGFASYVQFLPDLDTRVIFTGNRQGGRRDLMVAIPAMLRGEPCDPPARWPKAVPVAWHVLKTFEGIYRVPNRFDLDVRLRGKTLRCQGLAMIPIGADRFFYPDRDATMRFHRDDAGAIANIGWSEAGQTWRFAKVGELR
ncbi:MAG: serine hydrolase domain-containing protein [Planctomycetota bacterium]